MSSGLRLCLISVIVLGLAAGAQAQVGTGWTQFAPASFLDFQCGGNHTHYPVANKTVTGGTYTISGSVETFKLTSNACNRIERQAEEHYTSGKRQMQGSVKISQLEAQSIHQIFHGSTGPFMMVRGYLASSGQLKKLSGSTVLASNISGVTVRYNNIHRVGSALEIYINGTRKYSGAGAASDGSGNNNKYGLYGTKTTSSPVVVWSSVKWYR